MNQRPSEVDRRFDTVTLSLTEWQQDMRRHVDAIRHRVERLEQGSHASPETLRRIEEIERRLGCESARRV